MKTKTTKTVQQLLTFEQMSTTSVMWRLYKRHEAFILYLVLACTLTMWLVTS